MNDDEARKHIVRTRVSYITVVRAEMRRGLVTSRIKISAGRTRSSVSSPAKHAKGPNPSALAVLSI